MLWHPPLGWFHCGILPPFSRTYRGKPPLHPSMLRLTCACKLCPCICACSCSCSSRPSYISAHLCGHAVLCRLVCCSSFMLSSSAWFALLDAMSWSKASLRFSLVCHHSALAASVAKFNRCWKCWSSTRVSGRTLNCITIFCPDLPSSLVLLPHFLALSQSSSHSFQYADRWNIAKKNMSHVYGKLVLIA